jgi:hypothetical protein
MFESTPQPHVKMNEFFDHRTIIAPPVGRRTAGEQCSFTIHSTLTNNHISLDDFLFPSPVIPMDTFPPWSLQSIFSTSQTTSKLISNGLSTCDKENLQLVVEPILESLRSLDAEELLQLQRTTSEGAILREG